LAGNEYFDLGLGGRKRQSVTERLTDIQAGAPLAGEPPKPKTIQDISVETGVPWNVIETVVSDSGVDPEQSLVLAQDFAHKMKQEIDKGQDIPSAMRSIFGDDAPIEDALKRAVALAGGDQGRATSGQNNDNSFAEDFGRSVAGGAISGVGAIAEGAGTLLDVDDLFGDPGITDWAETAGRAVADTLRGWGQNVKDGMSDDAKRAVRNSTPDGKLFEPSTWKFEGDVSAQGIALLTADVLGSLAPVVIAGIFTGGIGGAAVGGLQGAGAGAQTGRDIVDRATPEQLEANSSYYNELIAKGMTPEAAKEKVKDAAGSLSAVLTAPISAFGGAFTGRLVDKGIGSLASKGVATRIAGTAAVAGAEEGTQEVLEGVAARTGAEFASGLPVDQMEGTFGEFVLGALGGGVIGAGRGAMPSEEQDAQGDAPLGLPAPDQQLPAPETEEPDELERPPLGVLARAAQAAPSPVEPDAPFPALNAQAGQPVRVTLNNGMVVDAEFVGEDEAGVSLKVNGEPALITRERMEQDEIQIEPVDVIAETAWADVETDAATNFEPLDDTTEPPQQRVERLQGALDTYLSEQQIEATPEDRAEIANSIDRLGGTIEQAVADFQAEMQMEALAQESAAITENVPDTNVSGMENERRTNNAENSLTTETPADLPAEAESDALTTAPATAQTQNDGTAWGAMSPAQREALLVSVGFADRDGNLNAPGKRAAGKGWDDLSERVREKLGEQIDPQAQTGAPVAPGSDPNRGLGQSNALAIDAPAERPARTQPGTNVLPDGEEPIAMPGSVAAAATETEEQPTEGQKEAENYKTGKADWQGLKLSIENRKGSERSKKTPDGAVEWSVTMPAHYGRILRTKGADGDHVDFYMGDNEASTSVWVIDQMDAETFRFDEHKVMLGFNTPQEAKETYKAGFSDGKGEDRLGGIKKMSLDQFKSWLADGDTTKPVTDKAAQTDARNARRQDEQAEGDARMKILEDAGFEWVEGSAGDYARTKDGQTQTIRMVTSGYALLDDNGQVIDESPDEAGIVSFADRMLAEAGPQDTPTETTGPRTKIEDFGEKIGGMRKDKARQYVDDLGAEIKPDGMSLAEAFPQPDYEALFANGIAPEIIGVVAILRNNIRRKPSGTRAYWKLQDWVRDVNASRAIAARILADPDFLSENGGGLAPALSKVEAIIKDISPNHQLSRNDLLFTQVLGRMLPEYFPQAVAKFRVRVNEMMRENKDYRDPFRDYTFELAYTVRKNRYRPIVTSGAMTAVARATFKDLPDIVSQAEVLASAKSGTGDEGKPFAAFAVEEIERILTEEAKERERDKRGKNRDGDTDDLPEIPLSVGQRRYGGGGVIMTTKPKRLVVMDGFSNATEARIYLNENPEELQKLARALRDGPNERLEVNRDREGPEWRENGRDATEADFIETLKFRGVAFGKSLTQKERQERMNQTFDAMMDMAGLLNLPVEALSLNGRLAVGFGTHGKGGKGHWAAVYMQSTDPATDQVIALTRQQGPGSLAHEWWHAVDNFLAREDAKDSDVSAAITGQKARNRTEFMSDRPRQRGALDKEVYDAFNNLRAKLNASSWKQRMDVFDNFAGKPYYGTTIELAARAFESKVINELYQRDMVNDYLVNVDLAGGAYVRDIELRASGIDEALDGALSAIETVLRVKSKSGPKLPDKIADRAPKDIGVGFQWENLDGWQEVTGYSASRDEYTVTDLASGDTRTVFRQNLEPTIIQEQNENTPEGRARREAEKKKAGAKAAAEEINAKNQEAKKSARNAYLAVYGDPKEWREKARNDIERYARLTGKRQDVIEERLGKVYRWTYAPGDGYPAGEESMSRGAKIVQYIEQFGATLDADERSLMPARDAADTSGIWVGNFTKVGVDFIKWKQAEWAKLQAAKAQAEAAAQEPEPENTDDIDVDDLLNEKLNEMEAEEADIEQNVEDIDVDDLLGDIFDEMDAEDGNTDAEPTEETRVRDAFLDAFRQNQRFRTIVQARKMASETLGRDVSDEDYTLIEEAIEAAVVLRARELVRADGDSVARYAELLDLYDAQPILAERTPEKMRNQAYSTPAPLAYVASRLAGIGPDTRVVEPSAGNGMLLMEAEPQNAQANELQERRAEQLSDILPGAVRQGDAMDMTAQPFDVLITNPPFGKVMDDQAARTKKTWTFGETGVKTQEIDHAMAYRFLEQMPDDGRAVLIVGSVKKNAADREAAYRERSKLTFYKTLYDTYNVVDHFTVSGDLYKKQGAAWPVDVIVIDGRAPSSMDYPMAKAPTVLSTWAEVGRKLNDAPDVDTAGRGSDGTIGADGQAGAADSGSVSGQTGTEAQPDGTGNDTGGGRGAGGVSGGSRSGTGGNTGRPDGATAGDQQPADNAGAAGGVPGEGGTGDAGTDADAGNDGVSGRPATDGQVSPPRTAGEAFDSGVKKSGDALKDAGAAIKAILNTKIDPNKTGAMGAGFLQDVYEQLLPHLKSAWANVTGAATDFKDAVGLFLRAVRERMGLTTADLRELQPYLKEYVEAEKAEWGKDSKAPPKAKENTEAETDFQVAYQPRSGAKFQVGSLVPRAMAQAAQAALDKIEEKHGPVDVYVAKELGYKLDEMLGTDDAPGYFAAEQVDALAMAIYNVNQGKGFIIGDQTGIGKGRFVAAMLRHAEQKGKIPIFVTEKPGLYADMVRDMRDIGMNDAENAIVATNASLDAIPITGPDDTFKGGKPKERAALFRSLRSGKLPEGVRFVFTTYDQMNASGGRWPERAQAIRAAAPNAMIVMDESHNAGGTAGGRRGGPREPGSEPENRAEFFRDLVEMASGTVFSSATYAKNPTTMSLYRSTNLSLAMPNGNMDGLGSAIEKGGVPLQQVIANAIAADGQYLRREKSFAGITFTSTHELGDDNPIKVERDQAIAISEVMGEIAMFDAEIMAGVRETFQQTLQAQGLMTGRDGFIGPDNISNTSDNPFASSFHNLVNQYLLAMKVEAVADMAIEKWRAGEKPIIGLMNVNSSIIDEYIAENGINEDGQPVDLNFTTIVDRYLERLRRIKVKTTDDTEFYYTMTDADMGPTAVAELNRVRDMIYELPIDKMPGSPVDAIMDRMRAAGMNVDEITGRSLTVAGGVRSSRKSSQGENKRRMNEYNSGALDGLIISASGATGFSMHATDKPGNDGKKRHMIIAQPHADINVFMQMLGRVNRTGQIILPEYTLAVSNLSLEKRVAAVLMKKMASLNANTTAAKRGATSLGEETDFINQVGDLVVRRYLQENRDLAIRTNLVEGSDQTIPEIAKKLTGRFAFLHPDEVDRHYAAIGEAFRDLMQQLEVEGRNPLEAKILDLDARTLRTFVLSEGQGTDSVLDEDLSLNLMSIKRPGSPYTPSAVKEMITAGLGGKSTDEWYAELSEELEAKMPGYQAQLEGEKKDRERAVAAAREASEAAKTAYDEAKRIADEKKAAYDAVRQGGDEDAQKDAKEAYAIADKTAAQAKRHHEKTVSDIAKAQTLVENVDERLARQKNNMREVLAAIKRVAPGTTYTINGQSLDAPAVVVSVDASKQGANPTAAGQIRVRFALADNSREIAFSLSQIMSGAGDVTVQQDLGLDWEPFFAAGQSVSREDRWMATGNLIAGVDRFSRSNGQVVIYTDSTGEQRTGLLMPRTFDPGVEMANEDVAFPDAETATQFLSQYPAILKTADKNVSFQQDGADFKIRVGKTRGRAYFLLQAVQPLINSFRAKGNAYVGKIPRDNLQAVLKAYSDNLGVSYVADNYKEAAREITGQEIPEFGADTPNPRASMSNPKARRADFDAAAGDVVTSTPEARKEMRKVRRALRDELNKIGIGTRITLDVREGVIDTFPGIGPMDGYFLDGVIGIAADTPGGYMGVLRHEVIHALRNPELWGKDHGLFTAQEWRTLVRAARQNTRLMDQVNADYEGLSDADKIEEVIAEMFREWSDGKDTQTALGRAFDKLRQILDAIITALRGEGLNDAAAVFERVRSGEIGGRGPEGPGGGADVSPVKAKIATPRDAGRISVQARNLRSGLSQLASDAVTNAMKDRGGYNTLALVPGRALFNELGKGIPAAKRYLRLKEKMDTKRNDKHAETDEVAQQWRKLASKDQESNAELMKLMHDSTVAGVDPSERFVSPMEPRDELIIKSGRVANPIAYEAAVERKERHERLQKAHDELSPRFKALPEGFQELYRDVRDTYRRLDDEQTAAIIGNVERAMTLAIRRAEREHRKTTETARENYAGALRRIGADTALSGTERATQRSQAKMKLDQTIADADEALAKAKATRSWTRDSQVRSLRAQFETNKLSGPYFPLARFGEYFVLARDEEGNVQSFSRHETVQQQRAAQKDMEDEGFEVQIGVMQETDARDLVDPAFVADIERMLEEVNADEKLMDDIWQRWLESLPDMSIRKHRIHRKNREGYDADALRAFGHHMFHGSHQLARLLYSLEMQEELDVASEEAASSEDPVRKGFIVNEMKRRHEFTMNPKGAWWASRATSLAFVYYLSVSPAAAIVNLSQTSIVGTSVLGRYGGTKKAAGALAKALADFTRSPRWHSERNTKHLSEDERAAMNEAYKRGVIDRTQSHDLAQVAESGVEYNAKWVNVMSKISWLFHHSERMNREVTFLAGYRLLREQGKTHEQAITQAGDATWEVHFDYQNTSKPRVMQSPGMQVLLTFRNFTVNFLWRIFRDLHQSVNGADQETRKEARRQAGVMASMMLFHAGIKGVYGYGLVMALLGMFFPDDEEDPEERLEKLMLDYLPRPVARAMLDGVPGTLAGVDLTGRVGMANLWFRGSLRPLEGADLYQHYVNEVLGPIPAIGMNIATGTSRVIDGAELRDGSLIWRGIETAMPKAVRDVMKSTRYGYEGALTYNGDPIKGDFSAWELIAQASGFTPKELVDQYDQNGRLKNKEREITDRRRNVIKQAAEQIKDGKPLTARQMRLIEEFNRDYPEWPITNSTINSSVQGRIQRSERNEAGVSVNPRLEPRLRASLSPLVADG
jgi:hypothetical protein